MAKDEMKRESMVRWLEPAQLLNTGIEVVISGIFGKHADKRLLMPGVSSLSANYYVYTPEGFKSVSLFGAAATPADEPPEPVSEPEELWLNYAADVGDGFDSTYSVAYSLLRSEINFDESLQEGADGEIKTRFEDVLIFGGDEVYPIATVEDYDNRLKAPYELAFRANDIADEVSTVFAIPGNHDWYDSLVLFSEIFSEKRRFAKQKTAQDRSYFALKLIKGWWLFATDMQLGNTLDKPQKDYFAEVMKSVGETDRIILCSAVPYWVQSGLDEDRLKAIADLEKDDDSDNKSAARKLRDKTMKEVSQEYRTLEFFEGHVLKRRATVFLSGDHHLYCRYEFEDDALNRNSEKVRKHKITAGGGGAFLHPTQFGNPEIIGTLNGNKYRRKTQFPDGPRSLKLFLTSFYRVARNWSFGIIPAALYVLLAYAYRSDVGNLGFADALAGFGNDLLNKPFAFLLTLALVFMLIAFVEAKSWIRKMPLGLIHAAMHIAGFFLCSWLAQTIVSWVQVPYVLGRVLLGAGLVFAGGWIIGSIIMALYLWIAIVVFRTHGNLAYSAVGIEDYKNFLRLKIDKDGNLTIYPIGIEKICRKWSWSKIGRKEVLKPEPGELKLRLIEKPIVIGKQ